MVNNQSNDFFLKLLYPSQFKLKMLQAIKSKRVLKLASRSNKLL
jgi:hypothetical protein